MKYELIRCKKVDDCVVAVEIVEDTESLTPYAALYKHMMEIEDQYPETKMPVPVYDNINNCWFWEDWYVRTHHIEQYIGLRGFNYQDTSKITLTFDSADYDGFTYDLEAIAEIPIKQLFDLICEHRPEWIVKRKNNYENYVK